MSDYRWSNLKPLQVGRYAEHFVKMELVRAGLDVYTSEVDDHGIDFVGTDQRRPSELNRSRSGALRPREGAGKPG